MSEIAESNGWNEWSKYVLKELEKLGDICDSLAEEISGLNIELTKISGMKHAIQDLKEWKLGIEEAVNVGDLTSLKNFYIDNKDIKHSIDTIKESLKKYEEQIEDYKKFKTKVYAIGGFLAFLITTALGLIKLFV